MSKEVATIYEDEKGWRIKTDIIWMNTFETSEEACTYALKNGCLVEGANV